MVGGNTGSNERTPDLVIGLNAVARIDLSRYQRLEWLGLRNALCILDILLQQL